MKGWIKASYYGQRIVIKIDYVASIQDATGSETAISLNLPVPPVIVQTAYDDIIQQIESYENAHEALSFAQPKVSDETVRSGR